MSNKQTESTRRVRRRGGGCLLTTTELAAALGESERTVLTWRQRGLIPYVDAGYRSKRFRLNEVLDALARRTIKAVR
jgi:Helix-turn-helix domain